MRTRSFFTTGIIATLFTALSPFSNDARAECVPDPYVGSVCVTAASFCPRQYMPIAGQTMSINQYQLLYVVTQGIYGNTHSTFQLPYADGRTLIGTGQGPGLYNYIQGEYAGQEVNYMYSHNLPAHSHQAVYQAGSNALTLKASKDNGKVETPTTGNYKAVSTRSNTQLDSYISPSAVQETAKLGGSSATLPPAQSGLSSITPSQSEQSAFPTTSPQLGLLFCVAYDGTFPPRS